jgi:hypothetical protein
LTERRDIGSRLENWARTYHRMRDVQIPDRRAFDPADALLLEQAMPGLPTMHRSLLWFCYVKQDTPEAVCMMVGIARKPAVQFVEAFRVAQVTLEALVDRESLPQDC